MTKQFLLPDLGEGVKEGQVLRLLVAEGDPIAEDQLLMEVETDKAAVEIPSPYSGRVARWHVSEQQVVNVGDLLVTFDVAGAPADTTTPANTPENTPASTPANTGTPTVASGPTPSRKPASPAVRKLARTLGVDLSTVDGSGPGGRVLRADVEGAVVAGAAPPSTLAAPRPAVSAVPTTRVRTPEPALAVASVSEPAGVDGTDAYGEVRRAPISKIRRAIAEAMSYSASTIPHVTDTDDADVTALDHLRRGYNESAPPERRVGLLAFLVRATVRSLQAYPLFNASFDEGAGEIIYKRYINIAVGIHTERGLVAPILRDADQLGVVEIQQGINVLVDKARTGTFALDDTRGATYTISNAGAMGGSRYSTPIITHPQVAVLAVGRSRQMPWIVDGDLQPRLIMPLSHSIDHRIIDGGGEIAFMKQLIGDLENPARIVL